MKKIPGLRRITTTLNGEEVTLLTVGHLAHALGRTTWTVHRWQQIGLLHPAPFVINPDVLNTRRWLWPEPYLDSIIEISNRFRVGDRLDREHWSYFYEEVNRAYGETVVRFLTPGVVGPVVITADQTRGAKESDGLHYVAASISPLSTAIAT